MPINYGITTTVEIKGTIFITSSSHHLGGETATIISVLKINCVRGIVIAACHMLSKVCVPHLLFKHLRNSFLTNKDKLCTRYCYCGVSHIVRGMWTHTCI